MAAAARVRAKSASREPPVQFFMHRRKSLASAVFVPIVVGCVGLSALSHKPRFAAFHTADILQLIASGMCFGVALAALLLFLFGRRTD